MNTTYAQKSSTVQKAADSKAASVLDSSSQGKSLQRKADMVNVIQQKKVIGDLGKWHIHYEDHIKYASGKEVYFTKGKSKYDTIIANVLRKNGKENVEQLRALDSETWDICDEWLLNNLK